VPLHDLLSGLDEAQYDRSRPPYTAEVLSALTTGCGVKPGARVLDLGAGTGLLTRPLLDAGYEVIAVEPLEGMRTALASAIGAERVHDGTAEAIPLPDASIDAVVCGDAYHWFDADRAPAELHRVLRPGGGLGLTWRWADSPDDNGWVKALGRLLESVRPEHPGFTVDRGTDGLARHGGFEPVRRERVTFTHTTDADGVCAYVASITFVALLPADRRAALLRDVAGLLERTQQPFAMPMFADVWLTRRR
jgi:SAM-dependent methyltransferase